MISAYIF